MYSIEIVTHCWKYSKALHWQLESLARHHTHRDVRLTVYHAAGDDATYQLLFLSGASFISHPVFGRCQPPSRLFNRAIGRNDAARRTDADWVWFCDADYFFGPASLARLATIDPADYTLCYPQEVLISCTHELGDQYLDAGPSHGIDPDDFAIKRMGKAIGGCQIVPGRIAREVGYCDQPKWQQPVSGDSMADTRSDRALRVSLGTPGTPIDLPGVYRLRHSTSGLDRPVGNREAWVGN